MIRFGLRFRDPHGGLRVDRPADLALGMVFLPRHDLVARDLCTALVDYALRAQGLTVVGWREVPVDVGALGEKALDTRPEIRQVIVARTVYLPPEAPRDATVYVWPQSGEAAAGSVPGVQAVPAPQLILFPSPVVQVTLVGVPTAVTDRPPKLAVAVRAV